MDFLTTLKSKPAHVKANIAFLAAFIVSALIALIWITTLPARLNPLSEVESRAALPDAEGRSFGELIGDIKKQFGGMRDAMAPTEGAEPEATTTSNAFTFSTSTASSTKATTTTPSATDTTTISTKTPTTTPKAQVILIGTSSTNRAE